MPSTIHVRNLSQKKLAALRRIAARQGVTPAQYVKHLIDDHFEVAREAHTKTFAEISKPFQDAFGHLSETELDAMVNAARTRYHERKRKKASR